MAESKLFALFTRCILHFVKDNFKLDLIISFEI